MGAYNKWSIDWRVMIKYKIINRTKYDCEKCDF